MQEDTQFMLRVAQSVAREFVERSQADSVGAAIMDMALTDWHEVRSHFPLYYDDLDAMRAFARAVLSNPHTRELVTYTAAQEQVAA